MENQKNEVAQIQMAVSQSVLNMVNNAKKNNNIMLPQNYSPENALKSAYLILQQTKTGKATGYKSVLEVCTRESVTQALFSMVIQGLNPDKKQCYFIPYGTTLTLSRSYLGTIAVTKRFAGVKDVKAYPIYQGDIFKTKFNLEKGILEVVEFEPNFENINIDKIRGAFALIIGDEGILHTEVMTIAQIKNAWAMRRGSENDSIDAKNDKGTKAHQNFTDEMALKTVINRACKRYYGTSDDQALFIPDDEIISDDEVLDANYNNVVQEEEVKQLDVTDEALAEANPINVDLETGEVLEKVEKKTISKKNEEPVIEEQLSFVDESERPF